MNTGVDVPVEITSRPGRSHQREPVLDQHCDTAPWQGMRRQMFARVAALALAALPGVRVLGADATPSVPPLPRVRCGRLERWSGFRSAYVDTRPVDVWLPDDYNPSQRYPVLYLHDGQMLFDATSTWNHKAWNLDVVLGDLIRSGKLRSAIVVAIWSNGKYRHSEYFPQKFLPWMGTALRQQFVSEYLLDRPQSDNYLRFIVEELKPAIDQRFATLTDASNTFVLGSSMGAVISVYAMSEYPQVFGGAAGLSVAWVGSLHANTELPLAAFNYLQRHLPEPAGHKLYMDHGDQGMDVWFAHYQNFVDQIVRDKGYSASQWQTRHFPNTDHTETDWSARLAIPLTFLLGR